MKAATVSFMLALAFLAAHTNAWARDAVLPAGTLLTCTLDEPNFSSATASVGDPILCYPHGLQVFGQTVFPRGAYIVGHLADDKEPGHFWGKGNLHIEFDRIGLPSADVPLSAKIIAVSGGYKVDKEGKVIGKGHATRDTVEWLFPPLWPWKIITLPMRGPRPVLKGETRVTMRLMDDVLVPDAAQYRRFGMVDQGGTYIHPALYLKSPDKLTAPSAIAGPELRSVSWQQQQAAPGMPASAPSAAVTTTDNSGWRKFGRSSAPMPAAASAPAATEVIQADVAPSAAPASGTGFVRANAVAPAGASPAVDDIALTAPSNAQLSAVPTNAVVSAAPVSAPAAAPVATADAAGSLKTVAAENVSPAAPVVPAQKPKLTLFALQAGTVYAVADYWRDEDRLAYVLANGKEGQVDLSELDWKTTTQLNVERNVKVTLRDGK
jgi:hypothetical protein